MPSLNLWLLAGTRRLAHKAGYVLPLLIVVTADRMLRDRVEKAGATSRGPGWLLDQL